MSTRWYCVQARPHQEFFATRMLARQGYNPLLLTEPSIRTIRNHRTETIVSLFGSYFFIPFDIDNDNWRPITSTYGVKRILSSTPESPTPIPEGVVENLIQCSQQQPDDPSPIVSIEPGCMVRVVTGPMASTDQPTVGICQWRRGDRAALILDIMQGQREVEFHVASLQVI